MSQEPRPPFRDEQGRIWYDVTAPESRNYQSPNPGFPVYQPEGRNYPVPYNQQPPQLPQPYYQPQPVIIPVQQNTYYQPAPVNVQTNVTVNIKQHPPFIVRVFWFIFIGWWLGFIWFFIALFFCCSVIGIPIGVLMFSKAAAVFFL